MKELKISRRGFAQTSLAAIAAMYAGRSVQAQESQSAKEPANDRPAPRKDASTDAIVDIVNFCLETTYDRLPANVIAITKQQVLDTLGVSLAGQNAEGVTQLREFTLHNGGRPDSHVWGTRARVPAHEAARINGTMAHALDYDDTHEKSYVHPAVITVPAVLAIAEQVPSVTGKDIIVAIALGTDISCRLALAGQPGVNPFKIGWHNTTTYGYIASALAAGKLLGLTKDQMINAAGIAYHQAAGNAQAHIDSALTKRMGPGFACSAGVLAAQMARSGVTGARGVLEGPLGLYYQYHKGHYNREALVGNLGKKFATTDISFKPYPSCRGSHTAVDAALAVTRNPQFSVNDVKSITIYNGPAEYKLLGDPVTTKRAPKTNVQAQFSNPWVVATILNNGQITLDDFTPVALQNKTILALTQKVNTALDDTMVTKGGGVGPTRVVVELKDGRQLTETALTAKGEPNQPLTPAEFEQKFKDCAASAGLNATQIASIIKDIENLENMAQASTLCEQLARST